MYVYKMLENCEKANHSSQSPKWCLQIASFVRQRFILNNIKHRKAANPHTCEAGEGTSLMNELSKLLNNAFLRDKSVITRMRHTFEKQYTFIDSIIMI